MISTKRMATVAVWTAISMAGAAFPASQAAAGVFVGIGVSVNVAPPPLPIYVQPPLPDIGYLWTPGFWAYGDAGYYWVPGVWVRPPQVGVLWTPGYWGFVAGAYGWHGGYWGPHVGFYGGVNYGYGYGGIGFAGGAWRGGAFAYNSAAANFGGIHVTNVYNNTTIIHQNTIINNNRTSFNGAGGVARQPSAQETRFGGEQHFQPTANQMSHQTFASQDRGQLASVNNGRPATMASSNNGAYHQTVQQHEQTQPISASDRAAGKSYQSNGRQTNQDQRIGNDFKAGQMRSGEAAQTSHRQPKLDQQLRNERNASGGGLPPQQKHQANQQQNNHRQQIHNQIHDVPTHRPPPRQVG